jgi:hypothetical protein
MSVLPQGFFRSVLVYLSAQEVALKSRGCIVPNKVENISAGQGGQHFNKGREGIRGFSHLPTRLVDDCLKSLFAAHLKNVPKLRIHLVAPTVRQTQPDSKQLVRPAFLHSDEVNISKQSLSLEVASEQSIRHLTKKVLGRIGPGHAFPFSNVMLLIYLGHPSITVCVQNKQKSRVRQLILIN